MARTRLPFLVAVALAWLPFAVGITVVCGLVYVAVQQDLRLSANDPQIQLAEDAAAALEAGAAPASVVPTATVDVAGSLAPVVMVFDAQGALLAGSARLAGSPPALPPGVLTAVAASGEERLSWQPTAGVRLAAVIVPVSGSSGPAAFVLAARNMREVERRITRVELYAGAAWAAGLVGTALACAALVAALRRA